jgi:hypothetical protein
MGSILDRIVKSFSFNRIGMMQEHYRAVREELAPKSSKDRNEAAFFTQEYERYYKKASRLMNVRVYLYVILYATLIVNLLKAIPFLSFIVGFIELGNAVIGTGIAAILVFLVTVKINLHLQRMQACMYHLVALYHQNAKRDTPRALERMRKVI